MEKELKEISIKNEKREKRNKKETSKKKNGIKYQER